MSEVILPDDDDIEVIEEDYIEEEFETIHTENIKQENELQCEDANPFSEQIANILFLGSDETTGEDVYHCAMCNVTFASVEQHLQESHETNDVHQYGENIQLIEETEEIENVKQEASELDESHFENNDIVCQNCDHVFETIHEAENHQCKGLLFTEIFQCESCGTVFEKKEMMEEHQCHQIDLVEQSVSSVFSCPKCSKDFSSINDLQKHWKCHNDENTVGNEEIVEMDESHSTVVKEDTTTSPFTCPQCFKCFSAITLLQKHWKSHQQKKTQTKKLTKDKVADGDDETFRNPDNHCNICNTYFKSSKNLKLHAKMHTKIPTKSIKDAMPIGAEELSNKDQFYCEICNKSFDHTLLSIHQNMHQNVEDHNCNVCNRQFENQVSYDMHMQLHLDQPKRVRPQQLSKPGAKFACNYCGREFLRPHEKVKHERIHTGEKPYECEVCGKTFRVSYSLTLHLRTHTDVRPFVCAQCNKRFKSYAVYSHHLNTHSEDRPYKCPMCPKSFRTSVQLCGHRKSHTKPYNCPDCNRPFSSLYAVKMHMKTHNKTSKSNENLKHRCTMCGAIYARMFALRIHMKEQHYVDFPEEQEKVINDGGKEHASTDDSLNEDEISTQAILQEEEIVIDNFHTEEIVTDWLTQK